MAEPFIDSNVFLSHLIGDHSDQSPRASTFFRRIEAGEVVAHTSDIVLFEVFFTLERRLKRPRSEIRDALLSLITLPGLRLARKSRMLAAFDTYVQHSVSLADAYHAVLCIEEGWSPVISFDRDFDRIEGVTREEP